MGNELLDSKMPGGPVADMWNTYKTDMKLVNPNNKRKFKVIVVGTGLAGASAGNNCSKHSGRISNRWRAK